MARRKITGNDIQLTTIVDGNISSVDGSKLVDGSVPNVKISSLDGSKITGSISSATLPTGNLSGTISQGQLAGSSVGTGQLKTATGSFTTTSGKDDSEYDVFWQMEKQFEMY